MATHSKLNVNNLINDYPWKGPKGAELIVIGLPKRKQNEADKHKPIPFTKNAQ